MATKRELRQSEEAGWTELIGLVEGLDASQVAEPGYIPEGWSVKDLLAHIGCWQAEAVDALEQIRYGTYRPRQLDVDALNARFYEAYRDQPLSIVKVELFSSHNRMLQEFAALEEVTSEAEEWFRESGPAHYEEHLPELRAWVRRLRKRAQSSPEIHRSG